MSVQYPAVVKYAPASVTKVADDVLRPEVSRDLISVSARPATIKKVVAGRIPEVIAAVRDVDLLVKLIDTTDRRVVTRTSLARHPKFERAEHFRVLRDHPWKAHSLAEVDALLFEERTPRGFARDTVVRLVTWCRALPPEMKIEAYSKVIMREENQRLLVPELVIDIAAGRVPGLDLASVFPTHAFDAEKPLRIQRIERGQMNRALSTYDTLDLALAKVITENQLQVPLRALDRVTDDAVDHLLRTSSAVELVEQGVVTDPARIRAVIEHLPVETRGRLARQVSDPDLVSALIDGLTHQTKPNAGDLSDLLDRIPDLPFEARRVALSHANSFELRDFFNGRYLNTPRPGEVSAIVDLILDSQQDGAERWYHSSLAMTIVVLGQCAPSSVVVEGIERLLDTYPGVAAKLLQDEGLVGRMAVQRISRHIGETPAVWDMLLRLASDWAGTFDELIATAKLL